MARKLSLLRYLVLPICLLLCAVITVSTVRFDYHQEIPKHLEPISSIRFIANDGIDTPTQTGYGQTVTLPHSWRSNHDEHVGWYTSLIALSTEPETPQAIYFPDVSVDSTIYLNDQILGSVLLPDQARGKQGRRPLFLRVPVGLWLKGDNELNIRVNAQTNTMEWMREFYVGAETDLRDVYARHVFHSLTLVKLIAGLLGFTAVSMGTIWVYRPKDKVYGWFAIVCTAWCTVTIAEISDAVLFDVALPAWAGSILFLLLSISIMKFVDESRVDPALRGTMNRVVTGVLGGLFVVLLVWENEPAAHLLVKGVGVTILMLSCVLSINVNLQTRQYEKIFLWLSVFMLTLLSMNSWLISLKVPGLALTGFSTAIAAPVFIFLVGYQLVRDFVTSRNELEQLAESLEMRVVERTMELREKHLQVIEFERNSILATERDRIMLEMHDGMGAHLVSILSMTDQDHVDLQEVQRTVKEALQDLRMMIDSLDPVENDLGLVLGMYRHRMGKILKESSISLNWRVGNLPQIDELTPHRVLQILRILQEAVTNAIKYSKSNVITVSTGLSNNSPFIEVDDNGVGFCMESQPKGRGLMNMQKRARHIGARVDIVAQANDGVKVRLVFADRNAFDPAQREGDFQEYRIAG